MHAPVVWVEVNDSYSISWISFYLDSHRELGNEIVMTLNVNLKKFNICNSLPRLRNCPEMHINQFE